MESVLVAADTVRPAGKAAVFLRLGWRAVRLLLATYLTVLLVMLWLENAQVYFPEPYDGSPDWQPNTIGAEDAWFQAADGTKLHGWYFPHPQPKAVVLFAHGNAGNVLHWSGLGTEWRDELNVSILIFDYRGYGRSEGSISEAGLMADARAARKWLAQRAAIDEKQIVLAGRSIGGGVMVDLAASDGARALILDRTFSSIPDVAAVHFPWLPVKSLMRNRYDSLSKIGRYHGPLLMSHGERDTIVPIALGRRVFEAANEPKRWITEPAAGHNDPQTAMYFVAVRDFLDSLPVKV